MREREPTLSRSSPLQCMVCVFVHAGMFVFLYVCVETVLCDSRVSIFIAAVMIGDYHVLLIFAFTHKAHERAAGISQMCCHCPSFLSQGGGDVVWGITRSRMLHTRTDSVTHTLTHSVFCETSFFSALFNPMTCVFVCAGGPLS